MNDLVAQYRALAKALELPDMNPGSIRREGAHDFTTGWETLAYLQNAKPKFGWLLFQSWQGSFSEGLPEVEDKWGNLLAAEVVLSNGETAIVEQRSGTGWRIIRLAHDDHGDGLWDRCAHLSRRPINDRLVYRRYWRLDAARGAVQVGAVLETIEKGEEAA